MAEGVIHVLVNGDFALRNEKMTGKLKGQMIPFKGGIYIKQDDES